VAVLALWWALERRESPGRPPPLTEGDAAPAGQVAEGEDAAASSLARRWTELTGVPPAWPAELHGPVGCEEVNADLSRLCAVVDSRTPALSGTGGTCALIEDLASGLATNPPDLASELHSYDAMLGNMFHLFRVAGRERLAALRAALVHEDLAEPAALALYRWATQHERCAPADRPRLDRAVLYDYAGFLFHTLGGQAYLRRRSPSVEALACFYGLQALDRAIGAGHNPQGLDPRPEVLRCRQLVTTQPLLFAARYAETLDAMARRWERSAAPDTTSR
jgi:hypothetical protein